MEVKKNALTFVTKVQKPKVNKSDLEELLYTFKETGLFPDDVDSVSVGQAILLWRIVESVRGESPLPENCKM